MIIKKPARRTPCNRLVAVGAGGSPPATKPFFPSPSNSRIGYEMNTQQLYNTFTNPKVVTSMLLVGIVLGLVLSALVKYFSGEWYMPTAFVAICLIVALAYMYWLDRQDWREM